MTMQTPEPGFKLGIVVLAHRRPEQLAALLQALRHPQVSTYVHIDSKSDIGPFQAAVASAEVGNVVWVKRYRSGWGTPQIVDAELEGISRAMADACSYVLLISGEDFPLKSISEIVQFFASDRERSWVQAVALPYDGWEYDGRQRTDFYTYKLLGRLITCIPRGEDTSHLDRKTKAFNWALRAWSLLKPRRRFPPYVKAFGGQQWLNLSATAAAYVLDFVERHPDYRHYHRYTACSDEMFIQSILFGTEFAATNQITSDDLRFLIWHGGDHPRTLTIDDLPAMLASSDLFARKIVGTETPDLLVALRELVGAEPSAETR